jgi:phosphatidylinositol alpha-1,6-mannosyltransferase
MQNDEFPLEAVGVRDPSVKLCILHSTFCIVKILLLTWDFPPTRGGIQTWMHRIARDLPDAQVRVLAPAVPGCRELDRSSGLDIRRLASARLGRLAWLTELTVRTLAACLFRGADLVVCGHIVAAPAALITHRLTRVPYAVFVYGYEIRRRTRRRAIARLLRPARLVIACSEFTKALVLALDVPAERTRVLPPGVDAEKFNAGSGVGGPGPGPAIADLADQSRKRSGARGRGSGPPAPAPAPASRGRAPTLLTVGRLGEQYKGHDTALRVLPLVQGKVAEARYCIVGDGPLRRYLTQLAGSLDLDASVQFTGGIPDDELPGAYRHADVLVMLGRDSPADGGAEGFGIVCLEAAACGIPVVAGRSGGLPDAVEDGVTGILVDPNDLADCAEAIVALLKDPERARRMGEAGRKRVLERFRWERVLGEARRVFEEAVEGGSGR